jgi:hypothetical protein
VGSLSCSVWFVYEPSSWKPVDLRKSGNEGPESRAEHQHRPHLESAVGALGPRIWPGLTPQWSCSFAVLSLSLFKYEGSDL